MQAQKEIRVELTAEIIKGFSETLLSARFDDPAPIPKCHEEWWSLACSKHKRIAIAAPRGHAKTTAVTKAYVLANVLFRARSYVLIISNTYRQSVQFLGEIKQELVQNDDLREAFGVKGFITDREDDIIVELEDGHRFRIIALGSEQQIRGLLWNGRRPDLVVGDDMENDEMVMNPERRNKFSSWVLNAVIPAMSRQGIIRIIGTILHMDAFLERLMPRDRDSNTRHEELKSYMLKPKDGWLSVRYRAHNEDFSQILWPVKWTGEMFQEIRAMYIAQGNPEGYYQEYLNRPIDPFNSFFRKEDFAEFEDRDYERPWDYTPTYLAVDGAFSTKERRDWTVLGVASVDEQGMFYLRHVIRDRLDPKEVIETILRLQDRFKFSTMLIGKGAYEKSIGPFLNDLMRRRDRFLHIEPIPESIDKRLRAQSIRGRMRAGGCKFNKKGRWYGDFEQEMLEFDRGVHDDQVDMMSLFGMYLDSMMDAPSRGQIIDMEFEDEYDTTMRQHDDLGRSLMTGY